MPDNARSTANTLRNARSFTRFVRTSVKPVIFKLSRKLSVTYWPARRRTISATLLALLVQFVPGFALAGPAGEQIAAGIAHVTRPDALNTQITQTSQNAIINWQSFSIGTKERVNFTQPNASSVALNRVIGSDPSPIFGSLSANGQVFLVNNAGVYFAPGASVNVGALVASSMSISDANFLAGKYQFDAVAGAGGVVNEGQLRGAYVVLSAPQVTNKGSISADSVALAAGGRVNLDIAGDKLISLSVDASTANAAVTNSGTISADGGKVFMTVHSANAVLDTVINTSGIVRANAINSRNGQIVIDGGERGVVAVGGTLSAAGIADLAGSVGGMVKVLGDKVGLFAGANVNVSGAAGGGTVLIGGNFHGAGSERTASTTFVDQSAVINADARSSGNGGNVALWADGHTSFAGSISAKGGAQSGNGGLVETSGKATLAFDGKVDTSAAKGKTGTLLLDPTDITISSAASSATMTNNGNVFAETNPASGTSVLNNNGLVFALGNNNVTVDTASAGPATGNITVAAPISWSSANALTLKANNGISVNSAIINAGTGGLHLQADGAVNITTQEIISLSGGDVSVSGYSGGVSKAGSFTNSGYIGSSGGTVAIASSGSVMLAGSGIDSGLGTLSVSSDAGVLINANLTSGNQGSNAIRIIAGANAAPGTAAGGDVKLLPIGSISVGGSGRATLFTGSLVGSAFNNLIGSGSGRFRYNSDEAVVNYTAPLSSGMYAVYRERPVLTISADSKTMTYGAAMPTFTSAISGQVNGDTALQALSAQATLTAAGVSSTSGLLVAGNHVLAASGAADQLGYSINYSAGNLAVAKADLVVMGITASAKVYDTLLGANLGGTATVSALGSDSVVVGTGASGAYADKNIGTAKGVTISGMTISGADAGNYNLVQQTGVTADITKATLAVAGITASAKGYDGTLVANLGGIAAVTSLGGDSVIVGGTASGVYADKNVGASKGVTISGTTISGTDAGNYNLVQQTGVIADITKANLTLSSNNVAKTYDGILAAAGTAQVNGGTLFAGDTLTGGNFAFLDKNVGNGKTVTSSGVTVGDGINNGNYNVSYANNTSSTINQANLTLSSSNVTKTYDGILAATGTAQVSGGTLFVGDTLTGGNFAFLDKNVGNGKTVTSSGVTVGDGINNSNYNVSYVGNPASTITRLASVTWIGGASGDWSLASNWAGGAIPDFANVAQVIIPTGSAVNFDSNVGTLGGAVQLDSISSAGGLNITSGALAVSGLLATSSYVQSGGLVKAMNLSASNSFRQTGGSLNVAGLVDITQATGSTQLGNISAQDLIVNSAGGVTETGGAALAIAGSTTLNAGTADVSLGNVGNNFGTVAVTSANNVTLGNANALNLGANTIGGNLTIAAGTLTQAGSTALAVAGTTTLNTGSANITLNNAGNDFATVAVTSANDVLLRDANAFNLGASSINGNLGVTSGALTQVAGAALTVLGTTTLNTGSANVTLNNAGNDFATVAIGNANNVTLRDANSLILGSSVVQGNLIIDSGALTQAVGSTLTVAGSTTLNASGADVTLGNAGNDFATLAVSNANNVTLQDANGLNLGASSINGNLSIRSGALTQSAGSALTVLGTTTLNAGSANITLNNAGNDFASVAVTNANDVLLRDANALNLGTSSINGNLSITSGALTQSAGSALTVLGTTTLNANGANVTLGNAGNDFATVAVTNANDVLLRDANGLNLGTSNVQGNLSITAAAISQSAASALTVAGSSTLNAGSGNVTLNNAGNDFIGPVGATGLEVTLNDQNTLTLSTIKASLANLNARNELQVAANGGVETKAINLFLGQETGEAVGNAINYFNVQADSVVTLRAGALSVTLKDASFFSTNGNNLLLPTFAFADDATQTLYANSTVKLFLNGIQINDSIKRGGITVTQTGIANMLQSTLKKADSKFDMIDRGVQSDLGERGVYPHAGVLKLKSPPCDAGNPTLSDCI